MVSVFDFLDYREYLKEIIAEKKRENRSFSHRMITSKIGVSSSGFLCNVIAKKCSLTVDNIEKLSRLFKLSAQEKRYFKLLLYFSKAKSLSEKNDFYREIIQYRKKSGKSLCKEEFTLFSKWYYPVIRELVGVMAVSDNYAEVGSCIKPKIRDYEVKNSLEVLSELGFISRDEKGIYQQHDTVLTTGDEIKSMFVNQYQLEMIRLAGKALEEVDSSERDISGVTLSISEEKLALLKEEFINFRKKIVQIAVNDSCDPEKVVRCNLQLFPLTETIKSE